ncbi:MAG: type II secretion system protein [Planctomycetota bacterium]
MEQRTRRFLDGSGFSLIELLVVVSVITLLLGILAGGIQTVKKHATNLRQKSNFHAIEVGLELFQKDYDDYPPSKMESDSANSNLVCGAQHLAEAMLGRDMKGFDPKTNWYAPEEDETIYAHENDKGSTPEEEAASTARRWEHFIELKKMGFYIMGDLYENYTGDVYSSSTPIVADNFRAPVITDIFRQKKVTVPYRNDGKPQWTGTPILYYKANSSSRFFKKVPTAADIPGELPKWIYNYEDNRGIIDLGAIKDSAVIHQFDQDHTYTEDGQQRNGVHLFYKTITNPKVSFDKPFNATGFILISAGHDGVFGTRDDIANFDY